MTGVETPPRPTERACPRCGAGLAPDQEWCLDCGTAVGTTIAPTPRWRVPVALVGGLLALLAAALVLALVELSGDPQPVAKSPAGATPTPNPAAPPDEGGVAAATPTAAPTIAPNTTPSPSPTPGAGATATPGATPTTTGGLAEWPEGKSGWTVVLASKTTRAEAESEARSSRQPGVGILRSDDFTSLRKGYWVVFSGQYDDGDAAESAAEDAAGDAYARRIVPR